MTIDYLTYELKYKNNQEVLDLISHIKELQESNDIMSSSTVHQEEFDELEEDLSFLRRRVRNFKIEVSDIKWWQFFKYKKLVSNAIREWL